jgi:flagellar biosynthetic protein FliP
LKVNIPAVLLVFGLVLIQAQEALAQPLPSIDLSVRPTDSPTEVVDSIKLLLLLTMLSLVPAFLVMMTSFTRIIIVLSLLRNAIGTPAVPANQILIGLALFLTVFCMMPTFKEINDQAIVPYTQNQISQQEAQERGIEPLRDFMLRQTREKDLGLFINLAKVEQPAGLDDIPLHVVIPAFIISELKTAFEIGFLLFVPFLVIDMVVASILMSMGMFMLPPIMISLPFKILLFIMVNAALEAGAEVRECVFHKFSPQGVSGVVVISESHLAIHTWPELGYAAVDVFTCGDKVNPWDACNYLTDHFNAKQTTAKEMKRGLMPDAFLGEAVNL